MKILIVSSGNAGYLSPFVKEQIDSLAEFKITFEYYYIVGKGIRGYLSNLKKLKNKIHAFKPDLIHAHYGLSGFLSLFVKRGYPLITTFHGNDINPIRSMDVSKPSLNRILSRLTHRYSNYSIFVNRDLALRVNARQNKYSVIPCHVDLTLFYPVDKEDARRRFNYSQGRRYVLFSSSFDTPVKNYPVAKTACQSFENLELVELKGYSRSDVNLLLNACDLLLITSFNEGSPQLIKEAMACNCPIVSTHVGDVEWVIGQTEGCYIAEFEIGDLIHKIRLALSFSQEKGKTVGRKRITELELDAEHTGKKLYEIYLKIIQQCAESAA